MDNFDNKIKEIIKKDVELSDKYDNSIEDAIQYAFKHKKYDKSETRKKDTKFTIFSNLSKIAAVFIIGILSVSTYAQISNNATLKDMGFLKLSKNYEEKKIGINKKIDNDYLSVVVENIASDSAYVIVEYDILLKDKAIEKVREYEEENENECELGIANRIWVNDENSLVFEEMEKISDTEYKLSQVINRMNFDDEKIHLKIWLDNFYIGHYMENCGVKLNKMLEMDIYENSEKSYHIDNQEQKMNDNTKIILEKVENSNFETYVRFKRITENISWKEFSKKIEYYRFMVASENDDTISSKYYGGDLIGRKVYKGETLIENYSELKADDIVRIEDSCVVILEEPTNLGKIKIFQTKSTFFSDRTNEEKEAYKKATWYPLEEGEKIYTATNNNGGTFTVNKITINEDNIIFYFDKKGLFGNTSYISLRVDNGTMNYIWHTKLEEKGLSSDENKITFSRKKMGAGLNIREGMLDDISKVEFTLLYGDVDEIIGEPFIVNVPEKSNTDVKIENFTISDTIAEKYSYKLSIPKYNETWGIDVEETEIIGNDESERSFEIDYFNNELLRPCYLWLGYDEIKLEDQISASEVKLEIEKHLKEQNIEFEKKKIQSGEFILK